MKSILGYSLPIIAALFCAPAARSEVVVQTPVGTFVFGRIGGRCVPGVNVQVGGIVGVHVNPGPGPVIVPPPAPLPPGNDPLPPPNVLPPPQLDVAPPVPTLDAFAATFKPCPGTYEVLILHPRTHEPVKVTFSLPEGAPTRVRVTKRELDFDYGRHGVAIRFRINGTVTVKSD